MFAQINWIHWEKYCSLKQWRWTREFYENVWKCELTFINAKCVSVIVQIPSESLCVETRFIRWNKHLEESFSRNFNKLSTRRACGRSEFIVVALILLPHAWFSSINSHLKQNYKQKMNEYGLQESMEFNLCSSTCNSSFDASISLIFVDGTFAVPYKSVFWKILYFTIYFTK